MVLGALGLKKLVDNVVGVGSSQTASKAPGFHKTLQAADFMDTITPTDVMLTASKWTELGSYTVPAQQAIRWGHGERRQASKPGLRLFHHDRRHGRGRHSGRWPTPPGGRRRQPPQQAGGLGGEDGGIGRGRQRQGQGGLPSRSKAPWQGRTTCSSWRCTQTLPTSFSRTFP